MPDIWLGKKSEMATWSGLLGHLALVLTRKTKFLKRLFPESIEAVLQ